MRTIWLCQDDEAAYDMLQLYREAHLRAWRAAVRGSHQWWGCGLETLVETAKWRTACDVMFDLEDQAGDLP